MDLFDSLRNCDKIEFKIFVDGLVKLIREQPFPKGMVSDPMMFSEDFDRTEFEIFLDRLKSENVFIDEINGVIVGCGYKQEGVHLKRDSYQNKIGP